MAEIIWDWDRDYLSTRKKTRNQRRTVAALLRRMQRAL